jgi:hypothetical protein
MPPKRLWTPDEDTAIAAQRAARLAWDRIAAHARASRSAVIDRARALGVPPLMPLPSAPADESNRDPLPAGHPTAWAVLTEGTLLDATPYPYPPL